jgi:hypothetical protein
MRTGLNVRRTMLLAGVLLAIPLGGAIVRGQGAAATGSAAAPDEAARRARGEVRYEDKWITLADLFSLYESAGKEMATLGDKAKLSQDRLADATRKISQIQADYWKDKAALDAEMAKLVAAGRAAEARFAAPAPTKPAQPNPYGPDRGDYPDEASYRAAYNYWLSSTVNYPQKLDEYAARKAQWDAEHEAAKQDIQQGLASVNDCKQRQTALLAARKESEKPVLAEQAKIGEDLQPVVNRINVLRGKIKAMGDALKTAPESQRLALGIVEWRDVFYSPAGFQALCDKINADIEAARQKFKENAGGTVPPTWRHPKQDEADAMAALLAKVKAAAPVQAVPVAPGPVVPAPPLPASPTPTVPPPPTPVMAVPAPPGPAASAAGARP